MFPMKIGLFSNKCLFQAFQIAQQATITIACLLLNRCLFLPTYYVMQVETIKPSNQQCMVVVGQSTPTNNERFKITKYKQQLYVTMNL